MNSNNQNSSQSSEESTNRLLNILIAVGIGIPVLIELLTLFNLINIQVFGNDNEEVVQQEQNVAEEQRFTEGDTLFLNSDSPLLIEEMKAIVDAHQWRFALRLINLDTSAIERMVSIDSLQLQSGQMMDVQKTYQWNKTDGDFYLSDEWTLPSGDMPVVMYISSDQPVSDDTDSTENIQQVVKLDNLPVRYNVDE